MNYLKRIAERERALWSILEGMPPAVPDLLPISVDDLRGLVNGIDTPAAVAIFREELDLSDFYEECDFALPYGETALSFEWYYDGREPAWNALGYVHASCNNPHVYSDTDLVNVPGLGIESDVGFDEGEELSELTIGHILEHAFEVDGAMSTFYLHELVEPSIHKALPNLRDAFQHVFHLRLYDALNQAFSQLARKPRYLFVGSHERWPVLVAQNDNGSLGP